jgi:hypothetical protein
MKEVRVKCLISNPLKPAARAIAVDALVDTGAVLPLLGRDIIDKLGIPNARLLSIRLTGTL